jgi:glycosyltransferase involved in cell wall biosynthesis
VRIAIDASELSGKPTGVGRYLSEILAAWAELPLASGHEYVLCAPEPIVVPGTSALDIRTVARAGRGTQWQQFTLPRLVHAAKADVLLSPAYSGPLSVRVPMVVSIHDLSFVAHPEWYGRREGIRRRLLTRWSARRASRIVACSEFTRHEIVRYFKVDAAKIDVVYPGTTALPGPRTSPTSDAAAVARDGATTVIYVGSIFTRRHVPELIDGFARIARRRPSLRLEVVGENRSSPHVDLDEVIRATGLASRIQAHSYVSDARLAELYHGASACVFLSDYEGFGMTPMEALAAGVPIVVLDTEVAREVYGPAALYIDRPDPALIEDALERIVSDEPLRRRLLDAAATVLPRYSWRACALQNLQILLASGGA